MFWSMPQKRMRPTKRNTGHPTPEYQKAMSKRAFWVKPLFGEAKDFHRLRRFRLRGLLKVNIEGVMIASASLPSSGTGTTYSASTVSFVPPSAGWYTHTKVLWMPFVLLVTVR
jgi:hypothetical protein